MRLFLVMWVPLVWLSGCAKESSEAPVDTDAADTDDTDVEVPATTVVFETRLGGFTVEIDEENAPITSENFLQYVDDGFYDGTDGLGATIVHRVVAGFVIQGGGRLQSPEFKEARDPIVNEAGISGLSNLRGTIAMARTTDPDSATSQWYINLDDNTFLDATDTDAGYAVFGIVTEGMDTVDAISVEPVTGETPTDLVVTTSVTRGL